MSRQSERDSFILFGRSRRESICRTLPTASCRNRSAVSRAACNGDWPADNGERKVRFGPRVRGGWVASSFRKASAHLAAWTRFHQALVAQDGFKVKVEGDPAATLSKCRCRMAGKLGCLHEPRDLSKKVTS